MKQIIALLISIATATICLKVLNISHFMSGYTSCMVGNLYMMYIDWKKQKDNTLKK